MLKNHPSAWSLVSTCEEVVKGHSRPRGVRAKILWRAEPDANSILEEQKVGREIRGTAKTHSRQDLEAIPFEFLS